jgi:predicted Na+-dependent transporter
MKYLLPSAVFVLMVSVGMSLQLKEVVANWRRLNWLAWLRLILGTFIVPPAIALVAGRLLQLMPAEIGGLFMVGVAPGAPLLTRNMVKKGFDMQMAASYQVWAALMVPVMIPLLVGLVGKLYSQDIWIPPSVLLWQIVKQQFLPLSVGMLMAWLAPQIIERVQPVMSTVGNVVLTAIMVLMLFKMGSALKAITPLVLVAAVLIAVGSIAAIRLFMIGDPLVRQTIGVCNANRHVGLALLLSGQYLHAKNGLPAVFCYALVAPVVIMVYLKMNPVEKPAA